MVDDNFKKFLEANKIFTQSKEDIYKILEIIMPTANDDFKDMINELLSGDNLDQLCDHIAESLQDKFDEVFTENELSTLTEMFTNPLMVKWLNFYSEMKSEIEESSTDWIYNKYTK
jgi:hypothetical protein